MARMSVRERAIFLCLILAQAAHSIEEYINRLYEVLGPARFVSGLFSNNLAAGFLMANAALVAFGLWCWIVPVRAGWPTACGLAWFWAILELGNGIGHIGLALSRMDYFPGLLTAPLLLIFAGCLAGLEIKRA